jgi:hypothetical protein
MVLDEKQIRMTLHDTLFFQDKLRNQLKQLIEHNRSLLDQEKEGFYEMLPKALLSQGNTNPVSVVIEKGWFTYASVQNLALRLADLTTDKVFLKTSRPEKVEVTVTINELWQFLYNWCQYLFPKACSEAIHMSSETPSRPKAGTYSFSSRQSIESEA